MALRTAIRTPFNSGSGSSSLVPDLWDCAIGGRTFMFDDKYFGRGEHRLSSIRLLRPTQSTGEVTEEAFNPADGVRVTQKSWHHGAGQQHLDDVDSDEFRFRSSKGVDVWTKGKLSLLPATAAKATPNGVLDLMPAGSRLYALGNNATTNLIFTSNILATTPSWTTVTSGPVVTPYTGGIASDGYRVWVGFGTSGIYESSTDVTTMASRTTGTVTGPLGYVKGRLMAADENEIFNIVDLDGAAAALPTALFTHPNTGFRWVGFAEGRSVIYAAGYAGDKSLIYKTSIKADGTALDIPTVAGELPDGEIIYAIDSYLGLVLIGTDKGWWVANQDSDGNLTLNKVQDLARPVRCFEGQGDFVWYGWELFDDESDALGRADLRSDTKGADVITPAYASDLTSPVTNYVFSIVTFQGVRVYVAGSGALYTEDITSDPTSSSYFSTTSGGATSTSEEGGASATSTPGATRVASGYLDGGLITLGIPDDKVALNAVVRHQPLDGTVGLSLSVDAGAFSTIGSSTVADSTVAYLSPGNARGSKLETRLTLTASTVDDTVGPVVIANTFEANYAPGRGQEMRLALLFFEEQNFRGQDLTFDPVDAYDYLLAIERSGAPTTVQHPLGSVTATLDDHDFVIEDFTEKRNGYVGTFLATFRVGRRRS